MTKSFLDTIYTMDDKNDNDNNKNNGMMTKVWGPPGWMFLHCITFGYPVEIDYNNHEHIIRKEKMKIFFESIGYVFPCKYCRESYLNFIREIPIDNNLNSRKDLVKWLYDIHNKVNDKLGVPACNIPSLNEVHEKYEKYRAQCKKTTSAERIKNLNKGCVIPADGKKKKCVVKVVQLNEQNIFKTCVIIGLIILFISIIILFIKINPI